MPFRSLTNTTTSLITNISLIILERSHPCHNLTFIQKDKISLCTCTGIWHHGSIPWKWARRDCTQLWLFRSPSFRNISQPSSHKTVRFKQTSECAFKSFLIIFVWQPSFEQDTNPCWHTATWLTKLSRGTISGQPLSLLSQKIRCLLIMFFKSGTTDWRSLLWTAARQCGHDFWLDNHVLIHCEQNTWRHGDSTGSSNIQVQMQQISSKFTSPSGNLSISQPMLLNVVAPPKLRYTVHYMKGNRNSL